MAKQEFSVPSLMNRLSSEAAAYELLEDLRWDGVPVCPHCGSVAQHYFLTPANGSSRKTRTGAKSERRVWKCKDCRRQFSVLTGTIFHGSKISVRTWVLVILEMCAAKNGISAREVERKYDLTPKTAWFMLHRIREAMKLEPLAGLLSGGVQADETWIGGDPKNRHKGNRGIDGAGAGGKHTAEGRLRREAAQDGSASRDVCRNQAAYAARDCQKGYQASHEQDVPLGQVEVSCAESVDKFGKQEDREPGNAGPNACPEICLKTFRHGGRLAADYCLGRVASEAPAVEMTSNTRYALRAHVWPPACFVCDAVLPRRRFGLVLLGLSVTVMFSFLLLYVHAQKGPERFLGAQWGERYRLVLVFRSVRAHAGFTASNGHGTRSVPPLFNGRATHTTGKECPSVSTPLRACTVCSRPSASVTTTRLPGPIVAVSMHQSSVRRAPRSGIVRNYPPHRAGAG